jgi:hypothetical protein
MMESIGFPLTDAPERHVEVLALRKQHTLAADVAVNDLFTQPSILHPGWRRYLRQRHLATVAADPRVAAAMARWERDEVVLRERLQSYLSDQRLVASHARPGAERTDNR